MPILPDVLEKGLKVVFCGTAVGNRSAKNAAYYADKRNQFWAVLRRVGLTSRELKSREFRELLRYGIGLTDLVKKQSGTDYDLNSGQSDIASFALKIERFAPRVVAFNGKESAKRVYGRREVKYGRQRGKIELSEIFVLPSTSGSARKYWDESCWRELAEFVSAGH